MNTNLYTISLEKYILIQKLLDSKENKKTFDHYDYLIISKCFDVAKELSTTENILTLSCFNLKPHEIDVILSNFINIPITKNYSDKRYLYEVAKVSNKLQKNTENKIHSSVLAKLLEKLQQVSRETNLFSVDFTVLRILDNFILKISEPTIKNQFFSLKKDLFRKMFNFKYSVEKKEKQTTYLCWIDRFLTAILNQEISLQEFIYINNLILSIVPDNLDLNWKILNTVKYLCFQQNFNDSNMLRKFKRDIMKIIEDKYSISNFNKDKVEEILINTLAETTTKKESFYYLFDVIKLFSKQANNKLFCLDLCEYLIYISKKQNIFSYRFVREYFLSMFFDFIKYDDDIILKEKEIQILVQMFHCDLFFYIHKQDIFKKIIILLSEINNKNLFSRNKFYKYCDILDYMIANNDDLQTINIVKTLSKNNSDMQKICKHFQLTLAKQKVLNTA